MEENKDINKDMTKSQFWKQMRGLFLVAGSITYGSLGGSLIFLKKMSNGEDVLTLDFTLVGIAFIIPAIYMFVNLMRLIGGKK